MSSFEVRGINENLRCFKGREPQKLYASACMESQVGVSSGRRRNSCSNRSPDKLSFLGMVKTGADFFFHLMFMTVQERGATLDRPWCGKPFSPLKSGWPQMSAWLCSPCKCLRVYGVSSHWNEMKWRSHYFRRQFMDIQQQCVALGWGNNTVL